MTALMELRNLSAYLTGYRFNFANEGDLQRGIEQALAGTLYTVQREYLLTTESRLDFLIDHGIAVEVKIDGSAASVMRQVARYAEHEAIRGILLVTSKAHHAAPETFAGKPILVHSLLESAF